MIRINALLSWAHVQPSHRVNMFCIILLTSKKTNAPMKM